MKSIIAVVRAHNCYLFCTAEDCHFMNVADTTRPIGDGEVNGREYWFVSKSDFGSDISAGQFVEYGEHEKHLFGTSKEAIRNVIDSGKVCVLNLHPQVCTT